MLTDVLQKHQQMLLSMNNQYPTTQSTSFTSSSITDTSVTINWVRGDGTDVLVVANKEVL